jgi:hypothetical protein
LMNWLHLALFLVALVAAALTGVSACATHHSNRTACLASTGCVYSNFSGVCCLYRGPWTCPDIQQGALLQNGGVYAVVPLVGNILVIACLYVIAVLLRPPWKTVVLTERD